MEQFNGFVKGFILLALMGIIAGCAETYQAKKVQQSGFLGDYSLLQKGKEGQALLVYKNPNANWKSYNKVLLDPVTVWAGSDSQLNDVSPEDTTRLAEYLYTKVHVALAEDYQFVKAPGPGVMHIQIAITEADKPNAVLHTVGNVVPQAIVVSQLKKLVTGTNSFVGQASVEVKITDGATGVILAEAVDKRGGGKGWTRATENTWADVDHTYDYWAQLLKYRLCQFRDGVGCVAPPEE